MPQPFLLGLVFKGQFHKLVCALPCTIFLIDVWSNNYRKYTEPLNHSFKYSLVSLLFRYLYIPWNAFVVYFDQHLRAGHPNSWSKSSFSAFFVLKRDIITLNKAVSNYLSRCTYHLLYPILIPFFPTPCIIFLGVFPNDQLLTIRLQTACSMSPILCLNPYLHQI